MSLLTNTPPATEQVHDNDDTTAARRLMLALLHGRPLHQVIGVGETAYRRILEAQKRILDAPRADLVPRTWDENETEQASTLHDEYRAFIRLAIGVLVAARRPDASDSDLVDAAMVLFAAGQLDWREMEHLLFAPFKSSRNVTVREIGLVAARLRDGWTFERLTDDGASRWLVARVSNFIGYQELRDEYLDDFVQDCLDAGMSSRSMAAEWLARTGQDVSYKTFQRRARALIDEGIEVSA